MRKTLLSWVGVLALWLAMPPAYAQEEEPALPLTHGEVLRDYARITFEWPVPVRFTTKANGNTVTIAFERNANPAFGALLSQLYPYVTRAERRADGKTIVLTLDQPYKIRTFISDNVSGIDLLDVDPEIRAAALKPSEPEALAALAPAAGVAEAVPAAGPPPLSDEAAIAAPAPAPAPAATGSFKVVVSPGEDNAVLRFPFKERVAAAAFIRANTLWIVFSKPMALDLSDFDALPKTVVGKAAILSHPEATVLRVPVENNIYASVAKEEGSFEWAVLLTPKIRPLASTLKVAVNTEPPAPPHVFIPALETADAITLHDPAIGDELVVVPLYKLGEGIGVERGFIEFSLQQTVQGVAVAKKADDVTLTEVRDGLRISLPRGATLTPGLPEVTAATIKTAMQSAGTFFPYDTWKFDDKSNRREAIRDLFQRIVGSGTLEKSNQARLRLAQYYLSEGLAPEALGLLDGIRRTNPVFYRSAKLGALRGAASFLMSRYVDAARDFSASELNNNMEADYWRSMIADLLGNPGQYDYLGMNADYISKYPPLFRQRLAIVAADRSIEAKEYNTALKIFDALHNDNLLDSINTYINFLLAKISSDTGQEDEALAMWDKLAEDSRHPFVQARAEFSRIVWGMDRGDLTKDQVIDRLERLRLAWHGDSLELKVLSILGDLYVEKKDTINAMRVWDGGVTSFPNTSASIEMAHKMEEAFVSMFKEGGADHLTALEAMAVYYQYRNYAPPGETGNEMMIRLSDRLIAVDLLDQAAALLDHQMRFQTAKEERSQLGAKLASIYLLNHQPKKALAALEDSVYGENPVMLRMQRNRLTAQAINALGQSDKALSILGQDDTPEADRIRLDVYWQEKDWPRVTAGIEAMLKNRRDAAAPITLDESQYLLQLSLAYVFQNNHVQLQYLRDYFGPLMAGNPDRPVFDFITAGDITPTPTNFDMVMKYLSDTRNFIANYKAHIQTASLSPAANAVTGKP